MKRCLLLRFDIGTVVVLLLGLTQFTKGAWVPHSPTGQQFQQIFSKIRNGYADYQPAVSYPAERSQYRGYIPVQGNQYPVLGQTANFRQNLKYQGYSVVPVAQSAVAASLSPICPMCPVPVPATKCPAPVPTTTCPMCPAPVPAPICPAQVLASTCPTCPAPASPITCPAPVIAPSCPAPVPAPACPASVPVSTCPEPVPAPTCPTCPIQSATTPSAPGAIPAPSCPAPVSVPICPVPVPAPPCPVQAPSPTAPAPPVVYPDDETKKKIMDIDNWQCSTKIDTSGVAQACVVLGTSTSTASTVNANRCDWIMPQFCDDAVNQVASSMAITPPAAPAPPGYTLVPNQGYFKLHTEPKNFEQAIATCVSEGTHLALPLYAADNKPLFDMYTEAMPFGTYGFFVGITDNATDEYFQVAETGQPICQIGILTWQNIYHNLYRENVALIGFSQSEVLQDATTYVVAPFMCQQKLPSRYRLLPC